SYSSLGGIVLSGSAVASHHGPDQFDGAGAAPSPKGRLLTCEDTAQDGQVVNDHAHIPHHGVVVGGTGVVVGVALLAIVMAAATVIPAPTACVGARQTDCSSPENPTRHKNHTNNFGPHRSMFLSIDVNRIQHLTTINSNKQ